MNEVDLLKYIDRIAEAIVIPTKRVEVLEKQNASNLKTTTGSSPCKIIPMRIEKRN